MAPNKEQTWTNNKAIHHRTRDSRLSRYLRAPRARKCLRRGISGSSRRLPGSSHRPGSIRLRQGNRRQGSTLLSRRILRLSSSPSTSSNSLTGSSRRLTRHRRSSMAPRPRLHLESGCLARA